MKKITATAALIAAQAITLSATVSAQQDYAMSCAEYLETSGREVTAAARERFRNLSGSCMGIVERDGEMFAHTKMVVRAVRGREVTLYLPATDRTVSVRPDSSARVELDGVMIPPSRLSRGDELNMYVPVDKFTQPVISEVAFATDEGGTVTAPVVTAAALPTTG